jgi:cell division protein FtsA
MTQAAETVFEMPVRLGLPGQISGLTDLVNTPMYATGVGLALFGRDRFLAGETSQAGYRGVGRAFHRVAAWVQKFFE